jgi:hypothetical protein
VEDRPPSCGNDWSTDLVGGRCRSGHQRWDVLGAATGQNERGDRRRGGPDDRSGYAWCDGSVLASALRHKLGKALASTPALERHLPGVITAIQQGHAAQTINPVRAPLRAPLVAAIHTGFASALDVLLVVNAVLALVGTACSGGLIRRRDFVVSHPQSTPATTEPLGSPV